MVMTRWLDPAVCIICQASMCVVKTRWLLAGKWLGSRRRVSRQSIYWKVCAEIPPILCQFTQHHAHMLWFPCAPVPLCSTRCSSNVDQPKHLRQMHLSEALAIGPSAIVLCDCRQPMGWPMQSPAVPRHVEFGTATTLRLVHYNSLAFWSTFDHLARVHCVI